MDDDAELLISFDVDLERGIIHYQNLWSTPIIDLIDEEGAIVEPGDPHAAYAVGKVYSDFGVDVVMVDLHDRALYDAISRH